MRTLIFRILKILGVGVGILVLLFAIALGWFVIQANKRNAAALAEAQAVGDTVSPGESAPSFEAIAAQRDAVYFSDDANRHTVAFHGYVYDHAECRVTLKDGVVTSKEVVMVHE